MGLLWKRRTELHESQIAAIETLAVDGRYLLLGPPGSGKTSILLHRGQYVRSAKIGHTNIRLVTFARSLREFIAVDGDDRFPKGLIQTLRTFTEGIFSAHSEAPPNTDAIKSLVAANKTRADAALNIIKNKPEKTAIDMLLVDEAQDLSPSEVELVHFLAPRTMFSGDARQILYDTSGALEAIQALDYQIIELEYHFRISMPICKVADKILVQGKYRLQDWCGYKGPPPSTPKVSGGIARNIQLEQMVSALDIQSDTYNDPADLIAIVVSTKDHCEEVSDYLDATGKFHGKYGVHHSGIKNRRFDPGWKIIVLTIKSCKGLEFRALHWLFADEDFRLKAEGAYTVITRAKTSLNVYHNRPLKDFMAGAFPSPGGGLFEDDE